MLVKIKVGDKILEFDSSKHLIALLLDKTTREAIEKMPPDQQMVLSGPFSVMANGSAQAMQWAMTDWQGAKFIPGNILGSEGKPLNGAG